MLAEGLQTSDGPGLQDLACSSWSRRCIVRSISRSILAALSNICSTEQVDDGSWHKLWGLPLTCRNGHPWEQGQVTISWAPSDSPTPLADPGHGHLVVHCRKPGCTETWPIVAGTLISALGDQSYGEPSNHDGPNGVIALAAIWALLLQAQEHQTGLLKPSHPSAARIARLRSWIQDCVKAVEEARSLQALISQSEEVDQVEEIAESIAAVVDAFHMYSTMLEKFRNANRTGIRLPSQSEPLAAVADDERVLLSCRAALRGSMQHLVATVRVDR